MARLYEFQSKKLLEDAGIRVPVGDVAASPDDAFRIAEKIGKPVILKIQVWVTGRAGIGGIQFANTPDEAKLKAQQMLGIKVKNFVVEKVLVEEKLSIKSEYFVGLVIDDAQKTPVLIFSSVGGTGIEEIARTHPESVSQIPVDVVRGLKDYQARNLVQKTGISGKLLISLPAVLVKLYDVARKSDARSAEINPLVLTEDNRLYAADCHMAVDDYAVYRHPELGIDVAREFDRPPMPLEKIAYHVEEKDYRGTFYFLQMAEEISREDKFIGFNGAGGGGSMMSMDAVLNKGFKLANYCDTSGNPSASKVYRAAKIILSQPNIKGYFASGSGVASQEQYHSARGLVKAFHEEDLDIPAVIRLGGNFEEEAIMILADYLQDIPAQVEGYGRDDSPEFCANRMEELIIENESTSHKVKPMGDPVVPEGAYAFETFTGKIFFDHSRCANCESHGCVSSCKPDVLKLNEGKPVLSISEEEAKKGKCTECLACEIFCRFHEQDAITIHLPIPGLKEYRNKIRGVD
ncbi:MAG: acetate--CoA ligase family protein [Candidatus Aminicenantes bacterium]|nr:MAG: acetate--CoA ligase family protein [Candidatus Aminicenantes bacterium]